MLISFCAAAQQTDTVKKAADTVKPSIDTTHKTVIPAGVVTEVSGRVIDVTTGKGLAYTGVSFFGSVYSTHADEQGKFVLSAPGSFNHVVFSNVGYLSVNRSIKPGQANELQIRMKGSQTQLKGVTVVSAKKTKYRNKGNPAVSLIQQIINHKDENRMASSNYLQYDEYERIGLSLFNLSQKFINGKFFSKYKFMLDSVQVINGVKQTTLPALFSEKLSQYYYRKNPEKSIRILKAQKQTNILKFIDTAGFDVYLNRLYGNNLDIYENNIFIIAVQFLSPISNHSPDYYKFFIADTINTPHGKMVEINFTPRNKGDLLFEGKLQVTLDGHYAVTGCEMNVNKQININFMRSLKIRLDFTKDSLGSRYLLTKSDVRADFGIKKDKGLGVFGERTVSYSNYKLNAPQPATFYDGKSQQVAPNAYRADTAYWTSHRTDTLNRQQAQIYGKVSRLEQMPSFKRTTWIADLLTGGYGNLGPVQFGPIGQFFAFNNQEGFRSQVGGRTTPEMSKWLYLEGYAGYGTKDGKAKYNLISYFSLNNVAPYRFPNNYFRISYLNDVDVPGQSFTINNRQAALSSFHTGKTDYWIYHKIFRVAYVKEFENHFSFNTVLKNWNQQAAGTLLFQLNDANNTLVHNLVTTEADVHLRYAPHEQILEGTQMRHTIYSKYPIFNMEIDHGFKGVLNGSYSYTNISANIYKRFYFSQLGYSDVTLLGGYIAGKVPFPLLNISTANQSIAYDPDAYNKMDYLEFVNDHYIGFNITQSFNGFLLNKIPLIQHLKLREFLSLKVLYGGLRNENNPAFSNSVYKFPQGVNGANGTFALGNTPYIEAGAGIGNIFKIMRIDVIKRYDYLSHPGIAPYGIKFSFQPDL
ncbi:MAG: DUF5686 and carboxypeptidase regulatory-like domain-containing protein [Bacteroidota bacterium]|nr:DUF5686 and carboxypeptidase regulatory-like domain-containing protein [Bacteroidota bacterium]